MRSKVQKCMLSQRRSDSGLSSVSSGNYSNHKRVSGVLISDEYYEHVLLDDKYWMEVYVDMAKEKSINKIFESKVQQRMQQNNAKIKDNRPEIIKISMCNNVRRVNNKELNITEYNHDEEFDYEPDDEAKSDGSIYNGVLSEKADTDVSSAKMESASDDGNSGTRYANSFEDNEYDDYSESGISSFSYKPDRKFINQPWNRSDTYEEIEITSKDVVFESALMENSTLLPLHDRFRCVERENMSSSNLQNSPLKISPKKNMYNSLFRPVSLIRTSKIYPKERSLTVPKIVPSTPPKIDTCTTSQTNLHNNNKIICVSPLYSMPTNVNILNAKKHKRFDLSNSLQRGKVNVPISIQNNKRRFDLSNGNSVESDPLLHNMQCNNNLNMTNVGEEKQFALPKSFSKRTNRRSKKPRFEDDILSINLSAEWQSDLDDVDVDTPCDNENFVPSKFPELPNRLIRKDLFPTEVSNSAESSSYKEDEFKLNGEYEINSQKNVEYQLEDNIFDANVNQNLREGTDTDPMEETKQSVNDWMGSAEGDQLLTQVKWLCRYQKCTNESRCKYRHKISPQLRKLIIYANTESYTEVITYLETFMENSNFTERLLMLIIEGCKNGRRSDELMDLIPVILKLPINKTPLFKTVINAFLDINTTDTLQSVITDILLRYSVHQPVLLDIFLLIVSDIDGSIVKHWDIIRQLIKHRKDTVDSGVSQDILQKCIIKNNSIVHKNVCVDFLLNKKVLLKHLNPAKLTEFVQQLKDFEHIQESQQLATSMLDAWQPMQSFPNSVEINNVASAVISDSDILHLSRAINSEDVGLFQRVVWNCRCTKLDLIAHIITLLKRRECISKFHTVFINSLDVKFVKEDGLLFELLINLGFNVLPIYDLKKKYVQAGEIIISFMKNLEALLSCACLANIDPYRGHLNTKPQKLTFLFKLLIRGGFYAEALDLLKLDDLELDNKEDMLLFEHKMIILKEYLHALSTTEMLHLSKDILLYLIEYKIELATELDIWKYYNIYLFKIINKDPKDKSLLLEQFRLVVSQHFTYVNLQCTRGLLVSIFKELHILELTPIYNYCTQKGIYRLQSRRDCLLLGSHLVVQEMAFIMYMYLVQLLIKNLSPNDIEVHVVIESSPKDLNELEFLKLKNYDIVPFERRVLMAMENIDQRFSGNVTEKIVMSKSFVKSCLEIIRRSKASHM